MCGSNEPHPYPRRRLSTSGHASYKGQLCATKWGSSSVNGMIGNKNYLSDITKLRIQHFLRVYKNVAHRWADMLWTCYSSVCLTGGLNCCELANTQNKKRHTNLAIQCVCFASPLHHSRMRQCS